jgi:hypothetical protein
MARVPACEARQWLPQLGSPIALSLRRGRCERHHVQPDRHWLPAWSDRAARHDGIFDRNPAAAGKVGRPTKSVVHRVMQRQVKQFEAVLKAVMNSDMRAKR